MLRMAPSVSDTLCAFAKLDGDLPPDITCLRQPGLPSVLTLVIENRPSFQRRI